MMLRHIANAALLEELENLVDQMDAALAAEEAAHERAVQAEHQVDTLRAQLTALQVCSTCFIP